MNPLELAANLEAVLGLGSLIRHTSGVLAHELPIALSSAWWRSSSHVPLLLEGDLSRGDDNACKSCTSSNAEHKRQGAVSLAKAEQVFPHVGRVKELDFPTDCMGRNRMGWPV
jgi:hypothetical protein